MPHGRSRTAVAGRACRGLDLAGREDLLRRIDDLADDDFAPTVVMVTHHVEEVPAGATHGLMLRGGRMVAAGPLRRRC